MSVRVHVDVFVKVQRQSYDLRKHVENTVCQPYM